jgi:hypothetical protein
MTNVIKNVRSTTTAVDVATIDRTAIGDPIIREDSQGKLTATYPLLVSDANYPASFQVSVLKVQKTQRTHVSFRMVSRAVSTVDGLDTLDQPAICTINLDVPGVKGLHDLATVMLFISNVYTMTFDTQASGDPTTSVLAWIAAGSPALNT